MPGRIAGPHNARRNPWLVVPSRRRSSDRSIVGHSACEPMLAGLPPWADGCQPNRGQQDNSINRATAGDFPPDLAGPSHAPPPPCAGGIVAGPRAPDGRNRGSHAAPAGRQDGGDPSIGGGPSRAVSVGCLAGPRVALRVVQFGAGGEPGTRGAPRDRPPGGVCATSGVGRTRASTPAPENRAPERTPCHLAGTPGAAAPAPGGLSPSGSAKAGAGRQLARSVLVNGDDGPARGPKGSTGGRESP